MEVASASRSFHASCTKGRWRREMASILQKQCSTDGGCIMAETDGLGTRGRRCTVRLETCEDGESGKTRLSAVVRDSSGVKLMMRVFDTLDEAFVFAQSLYQGGA
jgi:hypothetical protein